jgi:hypothetical protein
MNERIKELAEQAKFMAEEDINKQISYNTELKAFAEKFAQLIVAECFDVVINDGRFHDAKGIIRAGKGVAMEHFGVEE